jgi:hypothetical protein
MRPGLVIPRRGHRAVLTEVRIPEFITSIHPRRPIPSAHLARTERLHSQGFVTPRRSCLCRGSSCFSTTTISTTAPNGPPTRAEGGGLVPASRARAVAIASVRVPAWDEREQPRRRPAVAARDTSFSSTPAARRRPGQACATHREAAVARSGRTTARFVARSRPGRRAPEVDSSRRRARTLRSSAGVRPKF